MHAGRRDAPFAEALREGDPAAVAFDWIDVEVAAGLAQLGLEDAWVGEPLRDRHKVGTGFAKGMHVQIARLVEPRVQPVETRVVHLVHDGVMQMAENHLGVGCAFLFLRSCRKISEQERFLSRTVVGIPCPYCVRIYAKSPCELVSVAAVADHPARPEGLAADRVLEEVERGHDDRVDHFSAESCIVFSGRKPILNKDNRVREVGRFVEGIARGIDVDDFNVGADRTRTEARLS
ncbi:hypothetical protein [Alloyangia pacifica]|uniref:hypothetical protein n=1 Tax=Alloyangia pacifica TaxID=311180 RepID=UPI000B849068|nr:hypothetical protein [Alloyangia pacifica]